MLRMLEDDDDVLGDAIDDRSSFVEEPTSTTNEDCDPPVIFEDFEPESETAMKNEPLGATKPYERAQSSSSSSLNDATRQQAPRWATYKAESDDSGDE